MDFRILEVIQGLLLRLLCFLVNMISLGVAIYDLNNLILKNIKHAIEIFKLVRERKREGEREGEKERERERERFLIIMKLRRWLVILFCKLPLKMVL